MACDYLYRLVAVNLEIVDHIDCKCNFRFVGKHRNCVSDRRLCDIATHEHGCHRQSDIRVTATYNALCPAVFLTDRRQRECKGKPFRVGYIDSALAVRIAACRCRNRHGLRSIEQIVVHCGDDEFD